MDKKEVKDVRTQKAQIKLVRNHEILGMLKSGVIAYEISKKFSLSYSGAKKLCAKLKSDRDCSRPPGSGRKRKTSDRSDCFIINSKSGTPMKKQLQCI